MVLPIIAYGAAILRKTCEDISPATAGVQALIKNMWDTLERAKGAGLAAPQVNYPYRIFLIATPDCKGTFINPTILTYSDHCLSDTEGCLSIPGIWEEVFRPATITLQYLDENFTAHQDIFHGETARAIQHEYDHLNGKLYLDYLPPLRKALLKHKLQAIAKGKVRTNYPLRVL